MAFLRIIALTIYDILKTHLGDRLIGMQIVGSAHYGYAPFGSDLEGNVFLSKPESKEIIGIANFVIIAVSFLIQELIGKDKFGGSEFMIHFVDKECNLARVFYFDNSSDVENYRDLTSRYSVNPIGAASPLAFGALVRGSSSPVEEGGTVTVLNLKLLQDLYEAFFWGIQAFVITGLVVLQLMNQGIITRPQALIISLLISGIVSLIPLWFSRPKWRPYLIIVPLVLLEYILFEPDLVFGSLFLGLIAPEITKITKSTESSQSLTEPRKEMASSPAAVNFSDKTYAGMPFTIKITQKALAEGSILRFGVNGWQSPPEEMREGFVRNPDGTVDIPLTKRKDEVTLSIPSVGVYSIDFVMRLGGKWIKDGHNEDFHARVYFPSYFPSLDEIPDQPWKDFPDFSPRVLGALDAGFKEISTTFDHRVLMAAFDPDCSVGRGEAMPYSDIDKLYIIDDFDDVRQREEAQLILKKNLERNCVRLAFSSDVSIWMNCKDILTVLNTPYTPSTNVGFRMLPDAWWLGPHRGSDWSEGELLLRYASYVIHASSEPNRKDRFRRAFFDNTRGIEISSSDFPFYPLPNYERSEKAEIRQRLFNEWGSLPEAVKAAIWKIHMVALFPRDDMRSLPRVDISLGQIIQMQLFNKYIFPSSRCTPKVFELRWASTYNEFMVSETSQDRSPASSPVQFEPTFPTIIRTRELATRIVTYRGGKSVQGFGVYPAGRDNIHTLKEAFDIFPDLEGIVLIDPAYSNRRLLIYLLSFLSQWWHLEALGHQGQQLLQLLEPDALSRSNWWRPEKIEFGRDSLDFQISEQSGKSADVYIYAADYIIAPKRGNDASGPYLPPETIRERFPKGFSVSIARFPGWRGHLAEGDTGEKFYGRMVGETSDRGIIYVSKAHRPKPRFIRDGFLQPLYYSRRGIPNEVPEDAFILYEKLSGRLLSHPASSPVVPYTSSSPVEVKGKKQRYSQRLFLGGDYFIISNILERNFRKISNLLRTFKPSSPETVAWGGRLWQITSTSLSLKPRNLTSGIVTTGAYSVPLAVIISILFLDLAGSQPMAIAASIGAVVIVAPVSNTIFNGIILRDLLMRLTSMKIMPDSDVIGYLGIVIEYYRNVFGELMLGVVNKYRQFAFDRHKFFVDFITMGTVGKQSSRNAGVGSFVGFIHLNKKPLLRESFAYRLYLLGLHFTFTSAVNIPFASQEVKTKLLTASSPVSPSTEQRVEQLRKEFISPFDSNLLPLRALELKRK